MKRLSLLILLVASYVATAQGQGIDLTISGKGGNNTLYGYYGAVAAAVDYESDIHFAIRGGAQYSTIGRVAAECRPRYYHDFDFGRVSGEILLGYTYQSSLNNYMAGVGASLDIECIWLTLGYYLRTMTMGADYIFEPFNIYYELGIRCLHKVEKWDLNITFTNSQLFEIERHYQPSFALDAWWYPVERLGLQLGLNYKPAGMFNISSDYYQLYGNVGVCVRW